MNVRPANRPPRLPSAHLALTGQETFDDVITLLMGTVFRHLREHEDGTAAARALRDIALSVERVSDDKRNTGSATYIADEWVNLHL